MDFSFTPEQDDAAALAASILDDRVTLDRQKAVEAAGNRFDRDLWTALGEAGLLSLAVPEQYDGAGLGLVELCRVLHEVGQRVAPVPLATHGAAALLLAESGSEDLAAVWLPGAASGEQVLTVALSEERSHLPARPVTTASSSGSGWSVSGAKSLVRAGTDAAAYLVSASTAEGVGVFLVAADAAGVRTTAGRTSDGDTVARVDLEEAAGTLVGSLDGSTARRLGDLVTVTTGAELLGITEGALRLTAQYAKTREQFGRPIVEFQGLQWKIADMATAIDSARLLLWRAARTDVEGFPGIRETAMAKLAANEAAVMVTSEALQLFGHKGYLTRYPMERYVRDAFGLGIGGGTTAVLRNMIAGEVTGVRVSQRKS